jgi:hypothetical protein
MYLAIDVGFAAVSESTTYLQSGKIVAVGFQAPWRSPSRIQFARPQALPERRPGDTESTGRGIGD